MKYKSLALFGLLVACGKDNDKSIGEKNSPTQPQKQTVTAFLIQGSLNKIFLDTSSELRCEALKDFYSEFTAKVLKNGKLDNFECDDISSIEDRYMVKVQITSEGKTAITQQLISGGTVSETHYCNLPFSKGNSESCKTEDQYYSDDGQSINGLIDPSMSLFQDFVRQYVNQSQSKDLAFGVETKEFASKWIQRLEKPESLVLDGKDGSTEIQLVFTQGADGVLSGTAQIVDVKSVAMDSGGSFFECLDKTCVTNQEYTYSYNGHHLVLSKRGKSSGLNLTIRLGSP